MCASSSLTITSFWFRTWFVPYENFRFFHFPTFQLAQLRNKDGPHPVFRARNVNVGLPMVHEVKLSQEFCERFTVPQSGNIKLTHQPDDGYEIVVSTKYIIINTMSIFTGSCAQI